MNFVNSFQFQKHKSAILFLIIGGVGFLVDLGAFNLFRLILECAYVLPRIGSICLAVLVTYYLNREFTFKTQKNSFLYSFPRYVSSSAVMQGLNFFVYFSLIYMSAFFYQYPSVALGVGSVSVMVLSFLISKNWTFNEKK